MNQSSLVSRHTRILLIVLLGAFALGIWSTFFALHYVQRYSDGLDYAQIAQNVYSGRGLVTNVYPLFGLHFLEEKGLLGKEWPNLHRFPLPILTIALLYRIFGVSNFSTAFSSGIFYVLSIPLFYLFSERVLGSTTKAVLVTAILMLTTPMLLYSVSATAEMASIFFLILLLFVLDSFSYERNYALVGAILGISYYNRYNIAAAIPALVAFILLFTSENRKQNILHLLASFVVVISPWLAYNMFHTGNPLFSLTSKADFPVLTDIYPHLHSLWFGLDWVNEWEFLVAYPGQMLSKWVAQFLRVQLFFPWLVGDSLILFAFFFVGLFARDPAKAKLRQLTLLLFVSQLLMLPFYVNRARFYFSFSPVFILLGFDYLLRVLSDLPLAKWIRSSAVIGMVVLVCTPGAKMMVTGPNYDGVDYSIGSDMQKSLSSLDALVSPQDVICSDIVVATGRYVASRSLPLPKDSGTLKAVQRDYVPIKYIFVTQHVLKRAIWREWWPVFNNQGTIEGFTLVRQFPDGSLLYVDKEYHD